MKTNKISINDFEKSFSEEISEFVKMKIKSMDFSYHILDKEESNQVVLKILDFLFEELDEVVRAGKHRINQWEKGWGENANEFYKSKKYESLVP